MGCCKNGLMFSSPKCAPNVLAVLKLVGVPSNVNDVTWTPDGCTYSNTVFIRPAFSFKSRPLTKNYATGTFQWPFMLTSIKTNTSRASSNWSLSTSQPMFTYPVYFFPVHSTCFLIDISSITKLHNTGRPCNLCSATLILSAFKASLDKPGDPSTPWYHFASVLGCGNDLLNVSRTYRYAARE